MRILVAEDEALIALDLEAALTSMGHSVVGVAVSAAEVVRLAREQLPDVVLLDVHLGGAGDGFEAADTLERSGCTAGILFVTADVQTVRSGKLSGRRFLPKPFTMDELKESIAALLTAKQRATLSSP